MPLLRKSDSSASKDAASGADEPFPGGGFRLATLGLQDAGPLPVARGFDTGWCSPKPIVIRLRDGDTLIFAPNNKGLLDTTQYARRDGDVFVYAPNNQGTILAAARYTDYDCEARTASGRRDARASADAEADADLFVFAPGNRGTIEGSATAFARADAFARAQDGTATARAVAEADADVVIYAARNTGSITATASAGAVAEANAESRKAIATFTATHAEADILITPVLDAALQALFAQEIGQFGRAWGAMLDPWFA